MSGTSEAVELRRRFVFILVPMLSPDGVKLGTSHSIGNEGLTIDAEWKGRADARSVPTQLMVLLSRYV